MFFMKLTQYGVERLTDAMADGPPVDLTHIAVGDGNGLPIGEPTGNETALAREVHRVAISDIYTNSNDSTILMAEGPLPTDVGGWFIRETGVFDSTGQLFAYGNFPTTEKTLAAEGSTRDINVILAMKVGSTAAVNMVLDASVVTATRDWVSTELTAEREWTLTQVTTETELFFMGQI